MSTTKALPHWDMSVVYPGLDSPEFDQGFAQVVRDIEDLERLFDTHGISAQPQDTVTDETIKTLETVLVHYNAVIEAVRTLSAYIHCFVSTNTQDTLAQARLSEFQQSEITLARLSTRFTAWIGALDVEALIRRSTQARAHAFVLRKAKHRSAHLMSPSEEALVAELDVTGGTAWAKLHGDMTSQLIVPVELDGQRQEMPMSMIRNLAFHADRAVRQRAYEAELEGWQRIAVPLAAALNSIKGQMNMLSRHRQWPSPLDAALFESNIDRETLEAMLTAAYEAFPDFRRYLQAKAGALGLARLAWYDLFAPLGNEGSAWDFDRAAAFIVETFGSYSTKLGNFAARAFREKWIDAEPRPGKVDGAYCTPLRKEESRVFTNYKPAFAGMSTLAHELGHGYHNVNLANRSALQRATPMTLAETASIFCETIIRHAALEKVQPQEQVAILESSISGACQVVVDITSRFLFEQRVFERRRQRELSVEELNDLMTQAQRETYGDGLDESHLHPYMWAMKPHYYSSRLSFYNYPYMFGLLFGLGLYARYQKDPERFKAGYDELLSSTGLADAATLAARFEIDVRSPDFWRASFDVVREDIKQFEELTK